LTKPTTQKQTITIGNASGYWGDDPNALHRQVYGGPLGTGGRLDYVSMDFLAEITMSIMQKQKSRDPKAGYARDFLPMLERVLAKTLADKTCIITNAGGINPFACAEAVEALAAKAGLKPKIAVVYGDDILTRLDDLKAKGCAFDNMEDGARFSAVAGRIEAANVYFGAAPVVEALKSDPDIIITGRVTDTGITLAPMIHAFGWRLDDWDKLAAGIVAGHIIECGSQATGGNFTDWRLVKSFKDIGYPIVEVDADATFAVTKHPGTGGLVSVDTVREQLVYEMGNPNAYITPDVVADFSSIQLAADGDQRVRVSGVRGHEPTPLYKVSMAYSDGYKCVGEIAISGPDAKVKAEAFAKVFWERAGTEFLAMETELYGLNACHRSMGGALEANEIILRVGARDPDESKLKRFAKFVPSVILGGPPGVFILGGAPQVREIVSYWPALMPKTAIQPTVAIWSGGIKDVREVTTTRTGNYAEPTAGSGIQVAEGASRQIVSAMKEAFHGMPLASIALARSGDKGDTANIGVLARSKAAYDFLDQWLTAQRVKDWFQELCHGRVVRHPVPNLLGFNFLLEHSLGGGGTMTLRSDAQGKTFAQAVLRQKAPIPEAVVAASRTTTLRDPAH
jgi:hypothetical protein